MVSVETLGCKQPAPASPSWDTEVRRPHSGALCVCVNTCVYVSPIYLQNEPPYNYKASLWKQALITAFWLKLQPKIIHL